ncbi:MAG: tRNA (adenosine(37)-N6)-threonylcarbamoyltransferase complex ATPase subunit type 1 TsaE [Chloroflexi bacterium]|nr:tRNA (adenosine(37)-N6)-threonylcarbamoyltransferase complex ATPase subunit type 1 TsaE [Chloroflexota bacterium]
MPILQEAGLDIFSHSAEQTQRLGTRLGALLRPGDVVCLSGGIGAGKTVFAAGIGAGWGARPPLTSPTFNLVHEHHRDRDGGRLYHLDCYRLGSADEAETIGLDEILDSAGTVICEWPEQVAARLPEQRLWIELRVLDVTRRNFIFHATGPRYEALITDFRGLSFGV